MKQTYTHHRYNSITFSLTTSINTCNNMFTTSEGKYPIYMSSTCPLQPSCLQTNTSQTTVSTNESSYVGLRNYNKSTKQHLYATNTSIDDVSYSIAAEQLGNYEKLRKISESEFSTVHVARSRIDGSIVTIKKLLVLDENEGIPTDIVREVTILRSLEHPNIVRLYDVVNKGRYFYFIMEYCPLTLLDYITKSPDRETIRHYMKQLLLALSYCHMHGIMHRNIHPRNILISIDGSIKLDGFSSALPFVSRQAIYTTDFVTVTYQAPELLLGALNYTCAIDIWSVGCIFAQMLTGNVLFNGDSQIDQLYRIFMCKGTPTEDTWRGVSTLPEYNFFSKIFTKQDRIINGLSDIEYSLLENMLTYDPRQRITATECLKHKYFNNN